VNFLHTTLKYVVYPDAGGSYLQSWLLRRQRSEGSQLEDTLGNTSLDPILKKSFIKQG
jgi:hypothetical protein